MEQAIFVFTLVVTLLNVFAFASIATGHKIGFPHVGWLDPTTWIFVYPSMLYQAWFWSDRLIFNIPNC